MNNKTQLSELCRQSSDILTHYTGDYESTDHYLATALRACVWRLAEHSEQDEINKCYFYADALSMVLENTYKDNLTGIAFDLRSILKNLKAGDLIA